jgi:hypothetical protein
MVAVAFALCALGLVGVVWGGMQKLKAARIASAPFVRTGEVAANGSKVADSKGAVSAEGDVRCAAPLTSPVTGTPCLYYELRVVGEWKEGDAKKSQEYVDEKRAAEFAIDDGSGPVQILAGKGGDFEPFDKTFDESKKEGFLAGLKSAVGKGKPLQFGGYAFEVPSASKADKFTCTERVLKVQPRLIAIGKHEGGAIASPGFRSLVLSHKSREQLLGSTVKAAKQFLVGGAAVLLVGVILGVVSNFIARPAAGKVAAAATAVSTAAAAETGSAGPAGARKVCQVAESCCNVVKALSSGDTDCSVYRKLTDEPCKSSLAGFKEAVAKVKPGKLADCE